MWFAIDMAPLATCIVQCLSKGKEKRWREPLISLRHDVLTYCLKEIKGFGHRFSLPSDMSYLMLCHACVLWIVEAEA
jgi:hypothetical protein